MEQKVNILMVDDQPGKLLTYEAILGELGENLVKATSGKEALQILLKMDIAVVLMDVSMPELDGFQLADMIRQHPRFQKIAIIFISAVHLTDFDRLKGYQRGAMDYISVPVVPELLRAKVSVFAELHRKARQLEVLNSELERRVLERTEELRESESQFRTLANSIPQLAWMANPDGSVSWYNQRWNDYTGAVLEKLQGWEWQKFHHPEHVGRVVESVQRACETGEPWEETSPLLGKDGRYRWFLSRAIPIRDSHGTVVRWFGTSTDISGQIAAEQQIRSLNNELGQRVTELETIMQVLPIGVSVAYDPECRVITRNTALNRMLGIEPGESAEKRDSPHKLPCELYKDGRRLASEEFPIQQAAEGKKVQSTELELRDESGEATQVLVSASPLFSVTGSIRGAVAAVVDITERKRMEQELRQRADLLDLASEAIMVRDLDGLIQFWNSGAEAFYGWSRAEVLGKQVHQILRTKFPIPFEDIELAIAREGKWEGNLVQFTKDGREVVVATRKVLQVDGKGVRLAILEITRDITAQLLAEEALRRAEKLAAMGRVAGIIAHEINNPLDAIRNAFYLLQDHPSLDNEARRYARIAEEELSRVTHITRQTLSFYRESKQAVPVFIPEILDDILAIQSGQLLRSGIALQTDYSDSAPVHGFPGELKQVFLNLIGNAIQAMPEGGRLRIRVRTTVGKAQQRDGVRVLIADTGSGIRPEDAKQLFEPFFTTKSTKGTGLGLWISKGIVQKYEGTIRFRSMRLFDGCVTSFSVFIPTSVSLQAPESRLVSSAS
jgi:PAS domain S-box-containing protein